MKQARPTRIRLTSGVVGDYDGAYDYIKESEYDEPHNSVGWHDGDWMNPSYRVIEVANSVPADG